MAGTKVPWVDLQAPGMLSFIPTTAFAKTIPDPEIIMAFWDDKMRVITAFSGYDRSPRMERFIYDVAAQGGTIFWSIWSRKGLKICVANPPAVMYGGYPMEANPSKVAQYLTWENLHDRTDYPWGVYHEIGHGHQQHMWNIQGECTVNWFSIAASYVSKGSNSPSLPLVGLVFSLHQ